jgi:uncharacterized membrane protein
MAEHDDVYRTPSQPVEDPDRWGTGGLSVSRALRDGWEALLRNFWVLVGLVVLGGVLMMLATITCIGLFIVVPVLYYGVYRIALDAVDGRADINDMWAGFRDYGANLGRMLLFGILYILVSAPPAIFNQAVTLGMQDSPFAAMAIGQVVSLVYGLFVTARFLIGPYFIVEHGLDGVEAFKLSWRVTGRSPGGIALLMLVTYPISIAGFLLLIIGIIPAMGMILAMSASAYRQLTAGGGDWVPAQQDQDQGQDPGWGSARS